MTSQEKLNKLIEKHGGNLKNLMKDPVFFINEICGIGPGNQKLNVYQESWIRMIHENKRVNITAFRSSGKTECLFVLYPIFKAFTEENWMGIVISDKEEQAKEILTRIKHKIESNDILRTSIPKSKSVSWSKTEIMLTNGSRILSKPYTDRLRGWHVNWAGFDEAGEYRDLDVFESNAYAIITAKDGDIVVVGTPKSELDLLHTLRRNVEFHSEIYGALDKWENGKTLWAIRYPQYSIDRKKKEVNNNLKFTREFLCVPGDTLIKTKEGYSKIADLRKYDVVITHTGKEKEILKTMCRDYRGNIVKLKIAGNYKSLELTPEHPILTYNKGIYDWKNAEDVSCSDFVVQVDYMDKPKIYPLLDLMAMEIPLTQEFKTRSRSYIWIPSNNLARRTKKLPKTAISRYVELGDDFFELLGWYCAEGHIGSVGKNVTLSLNRNEKKEIVEIKKLCYNVFRKRATSRDVKQSVTNIYFNSRHIAQLFQFMGKKLAHQKKLNPCIFTRPDSSKIAFLRGYFRGDGCYKIKNRATCSSVSHSLILDVRRLLDSLGIPSSLSFNKVDEESVLLGRHVRQRDYYRLTIGGKAYHKFMKLVEGKTFDESKKVYLDFDGKHCLYKILDKEIVPYRGKVYNLQTWDDNSYVTDICVLHNCKVLSSGEELFPYGVIEASFDYDRGFDDKRVEGYTYFMGLDFALSGESKGADYSVFTVMQRDDKTGVIRLVYMERYQGETYEEQKKHILRIYRKFKPTRVVCDEGNFGKNFLQELRAKHLPIKGFRFHTKREELLEVFRNAFDTNFHENRDAKGNLLKLPFKERKFLINYGKQDIRCVQLIDQLVKELMAFGVVFKSSRTGDLTGKVRFESVKQHDDCVMASALCYWGCRSQQTGEFYISRGNSRAPNPGYAPFFKMT